VAWQACSASSIEALTGKSPSSGSSERQGCGCGSIAVGTIRPLRKGRGSRHTDGGCRPEQSAASCLLNETKRDDQQWFSWPNRVHRRDEADSPTASCGHSFRNAPSAEKDAFGALRVAIWPAPLMTTKVNWSHRCGRLIRGLALGARSIHDRRLVSAGWTGKNRRCGPKVTHLWELGHRLVNSILLIPGGSDLKNSSLAWCIPTGGSQRPCKLALAKRPNVMDLASNNLLLHLQQIISQIAPEDPTKTQEAGGRFKKFLDGLSPQQCVELRQYLESACNNFPRTWKRRLTPLLKEKLRRSIELVSLPAPLCDKPAVPVGLSASDAVPTPKLKGQLGAEAEVGVPVDLLVDLGYRLNELRDAWIFDWSHSYRNLVGEVFQRALESLEKKPDDDRPLATIEDLFNRHTIDIFTKGYKVRIKTASHPQAIRISVSGLQRFLDLPFESYSAVARSTPDSVRGLAARRVCSSMLIGILLGYGETEFGDQTGWQLLVPNSRSWVDSLAFLVPEHMHQFLLKLEHGSFRDSLSDVIAPVFEAIDRVIRNAPQNQLPLPTSGEYEPCVNRLGVILELPGVPDHLRFLEIHCFLDPGEVREDTLRF
jgi:hypothetical protein